MSDVDEYKSFYKTVGGGEGDRCKYPTRLDTYGKGCANNCSYCYARSLLGFRKLWHPESPAKASLDKIRRTIRNRIYPGSVVRLGGMTDCFQSIEQSEHVTYNTIKALNERNIGYLIVTKNPLVARDDYIELYDKRLAHIQISVTSTDDELNRTYEHAEPYSERKKAIEKLYALGFDVQVRLSPYIPQFVDLDEINSIQCEKLLVEFLRVNHNVKRLFDINYAPYTLKHGGYLHLPLEEKLALLEGLHGFPEVSICDDVPDHYEYFRHNVNADKDDCCNLRKPRGMKL